MKLVEYMDDKGEVEFAEIKPVPLYSEDSLKIVALFHDISKANFL